MGWRELELSKFLAREPLDTTVIVQTTEAAILRLQKAGP